MPRIAVIIPYYQRQSGILRRALGSVTRQDLPTGATLDVLVVDDASPAPPEPEVAATPAAPGVSVRILKKRNGGPARARNVGLDHAEGADFVAFLDSDDMWAPHHIAEALEGLKHADVFFADIWDTDEKRWFEYLDYFCKDVAHKHVAVAGSKSLFIFPGQSITEPLALECLLHTSTVVYRFAKHPNVRYDEALRYAGEDQLFWLRLCARATGAAFTTHPGARRGDGINLYRSALEWSSPNCVRRLLDRLVLHRTIAREFSHMANGSQIRRMVSQLRDGIAYLFVRNAIRHPLSNARCLASYLRRDPVGAAMLPFSAPRVLYRRATGTFVFPRG